VLTVEGYVRLADKERRRSAKSFVVGALPTPDSNLLSITDVIISKNLRFRKPNKTPIFMIDDTPIRTDMQHWLTNNSEYELAQRIAFVPEDVLELLWFESYDRAREILSAHGY
jgi:hypothetical protein